MTRPAIIEIDRLKRRQYPARKLVKAMTIAIGFRCSNSLILCTDSQVSSVDHHKYYEQKIFAIEAPNGVVVLAYSGLPSLIKEVFGKTYKQLEETEITVDFVYGVLDTILTDMGRQYAEVQLQLVAAFSARKQPLEMLAFDGKGLHTGDYFSCFGVGDTSLVHYLKDSLYSPGMDTEHGKALAIYLVSKAKKYVDHVEGDIQLTVVKENGIWETFDGDPEIWDKDSMMEAAESFYLPEILKKGVKGI